MSDLTHLTCCDDNLAMCGADVSNEPLLEGPEGVYEIKCGACQEVLIYKEACPSPTCIFGKSP